jgi:hypothetical protein
MKDAYTQFKSRWEQARPSNPSKEEASLFIADNFCLFPFAALFLSASTSQTLVNLYFLVLMVLATLKR